MVLPRWGVVQSDGPFVYVTNWVCRKCQQGEEHSPCYFDPYEGLVMQTEADKLIGWSPQNIQTLDMRPATRAEQNLIIPQYKARLELIAKGKA